MRDIKLENISLIIFFIFFIICGINCKGKQEKTLQDTYNQQSETSNKPKIPECYWTVGFFNDDFGDKTNEKYIYTFIEGKFSNSATLNSYLGVKIIFKKNMAGIFLHEYGINSPAEYFKAKIKMKNSRGDLLEIKGYEKWNAKGGITVEDRRSAINDYFTRCKNFIENSDEIKVVITDEYSSIYEFTINSAGFAEAFSKL